MHVISLQIQASKHVCIFVPLRKRITQKDSQIESHRGTSAHILSFERQRHFEL